MRPLLFELSAADGIAQALAERVGGDCGTLSRRQFPDGESYLRIETPLSGRDVLLLCTLDRPDQKLAPLLFAAAAAREQGARSIGLIAPYLAYMRQDKAFHPGEAITSATFAKLLSERIDWLVTLDPHLHRYPALSAIYSVPALAATATGPVGDWLRDNVDHPVIIGPDEESSQWVERIAERAGASFAVLRKERGGDYSVRIDGTALDRLGRGTPVIVDDIASSARTMIETVDLLKAHGRPQPICVAVHPIFAEDSYQRLLNAGAGRVVSTNAVAHESNSIDISAPLGEAVRSILAALGTAGAAADRSSPTPSLAAKGD
jgi:ribose-phosphate pyrophosphokinase